MTGACPFCDGRGFVRRLTGRSEPCAACSARDVVERAMAEREVATDAVVAAYLRHVPHPGDPESRVPDTYAQVSADLERDR